MTRRCAAGRLAPVEGDQIRISVEVFVEPHRLVHLTTGRVLMIVLQELHDDRVPVHLMRVAVSGQLPPEECG